MDCPLFLVMKLQVLLERIIQQESYDMALLQKGLHVMIYATAKLGYCSIGYNHACNVHVFTARHWAG